MKRITEKRSLRKKNRDTTLKKKMQNVIFKGLSEKVLTIYEAADLESVWQEHWLTDVTTKQEENFQRRD